MTSTHLPKDQRIFYKECISLAKEKYDVCLVEQGDSETINGVRIIGTGETNKSRYYRLIIRPYMIYRLALKENADIYHFHDMELLPYGVRLKKKGKKVVFDYHEDYAMRFSESDFFHFPKLIKNILTSLYVSYEKKSIKELDAMISVTPHICERLSKTNQKTVMITNYPLVEEFGWENKGEYDKQSDHICFVGQISFDYCLDKVALAIQNIEGLKFVICGNVRRESELKDVLNFDLHNIIEYLGRVPYTKVPKILRFSLASVILHNYCANTAGNIGTLGSNKLFESMLCGVPVICTDFVLWKQIIEKYHCGICVDNDSVDSIREAIVYLMSNRDEAEQMGRNGRKAVLEEFNWNKQSEILLKLYKEIGSE